MQSLTGHSVKVNTKMKVNTKINCNHIHINECTFYFSFFPFYSKFFEVFWVLWKRRLKKRKKVRPKKYSCFRKCGWREKFLPGRPQIYFFNRFSGDNIFSSLVSFAFFYSCFVCLFFYTLIHIRLCGRLSDKKIFIRPISGNKIASFFGLIRNK